MDVEIPSWLDEAFLTSALQGCEVRDPRVTIVRFSVARAVPAGTNYISVLYRVKVNYKVGNKEDNISLIVKSPTTAGLVGEITKYCDHSAMESIIYNKVLPVFNDLLKCKFSPKLFYSSVKDVLVLEDLKDEGYEVGDRHKQLDFQHCQFVLKSLAKFHAASVVCKRDHPDIIIEASKEALYNPHPMFYEKIKPWIEDSLKAVVEVVSQMVLGKDVEEMFKRRIETAAEIMVKVSKPKTYGLNVLNHGDMWVNNILFKHSYLGIIEDIKLIDYQLRRYGSPVGDLMYFVWTSANEEVRDSKLPELFEMYRLTLNTTLEQLGCVERLSEDEFHQDLREATDVAILLVAHILPITSSDTGIAPNVDPQSGLFLDAFGGKDYLFGGKYFKALLPKLAEHLQKWNNIYF